MNKNPAQMGGRLGFREAGKKTMARVGKGHVEGHATEGKGDKSY